ncbi:MAG: aminotransferase class V-fold PLP-dependent enzyme [Verrucomicrobiales bacterium]|nr:aminotransferase class V-fold PLP-dependent enzyme [Verrucomicrobiales bacterium]
MLTETTRTRDFPSLAGRTYLNTAAEGIPPRETGWALERYWADKCQGMRGREAHFAEMEACREVAAEMVGLEAEEVAFCSCSSEAYNLLASALSLGESDEVVVTDLDFPAGATPWLRAQPSPLVRLWRSGHGELEPADLAALLTERTRLVQVSLVSFYNGHRLDWDEVVETVRQRAPEAVLAVDVTQALGRVVLQGAEALTGADIIISSTHKWALGVHGGCVVGIPRRNAERLTTRAGGWFHLSNAFEADRFDRAVSKAGAASYAVGMPNFPAIYALNAGLRYLREQGLTEVQARADALTARLAAGLTDLGVGLMCPWRVERPSGIMAFQHERSSEMHAALEAEEIHVMHHAGRLRMAVHGYNTEADVDRFLEVMRRLV